MDVKEDSIFDDPKNLPFSTDEYPALAQRWKLTCIATAVIAIVLFPGVGYLTYFGFISLDETRVGLAILDGCSSCGIRYHDLQKYDSISGVVYAGVLIALLPYSLIVYGIFMYVYIIAWWRAGSLARVSRDALKGLSAICVMLALSLWFLLFMDVQISQGPYPGVSRVYLWSIFPVLVGLAAPILCLFVAAISIFQIKYLAQKAKL